VTSILTIPACEMGGVYQMTVEALSKVNQGKVSCNSPLILTTMCVFSMVLLVLCLLGFDDRLMTLPRMSSKEKTTFMALLKRHLIP